MRLRTITSPSGARFTVDETYADKFQSFLGDLEGAGYAINGSQSGGYNPRNIRGTNTPSNHAFGRAIDINWTDNPQGGTGKIPADLARSLAGKYGMRWGGDYKTAKPDPMHFEFVGGASPPVQNRSLTAFAGHSSAKPEAPMTNPIHQSGYGRQPAPTGGETYGPSPPASQGAFASMQQKFGESPLGILSSGLQRGDSTDIGAGLQGVAGGAFGALGQAFGGGQEEQKDSGLDEAAIQANATALASEDQKQAQIIQAMMARHQKPRGAFV